MHIFGVSIGDITGIIAIAGATLSVFSWIFKKLVMDQFNESVKDLKSSINGLRKSLTIMNEKHERQINDIDEQLKSHDISIHEINKDIENMKGSK